MESADAQSGVPAAAPAQYGRDFLLYAQGQAVSMVGDRIATIALVFLVVHLSGSYAPALALFYVVRVLPALPGGILVGVVVDQIDRRFLMIAADLARAALLVAVPTLSDLQLWALYPMVFGLYGLSLVFSAAAQAMLPDIVPSARLTGANGLLQAISNAADFAYALGGVLIFVLHYEIPFYIDATTFVFSALMVSRMRFPEQRHKAALGPRQVAGRIREGIDYLLTHTFLRYATLAMIVGPVAGGAVWVVVPLYAQHVLAQSSGLAGPLVSGPFRFSVLEVCIGAGAVVGSLVSERLATRWPRGTIFGFGIAGLGLCDACLALTTNFYVAAIIMIVSGVFNSLFVVSGVTLIQTLTPSELRGRVGTAQSTATTAALALGAALAAPALLVLSYTLLLLVLGGIIMAASLCVWLVPSVRQQA